MRRALIGSIAVLVAVLPACGSDSDGKGDLASGKLFDPVDVTRCLRGEGFSVDAPQSGLEIDFTVRRPDGRNSIDVGVEPTASDAADREKEWRKLADEAGVEDAQSYYFRYGNLVLGYERIPTGAFRRKIERCLA